MIPIEEFKAEFSCTDGAGSKTWRGCTVVGLATDVHEPHFVVLVLGPTIYAMTVDEIRKPEPRA
jgi:hypothetical protein